MIFLPEHVVKKLLNWDEIYQAIEIALLSVSRKCVLQPPRTLTTVPGKENTLFTMPGYLEGGTGAKDFSSLGCKLVTAFPRNTTDYGLPTILANILLFDQKNGKLQAVIESTEITAWRTAAASVVATKYLRKNKQENKVLAIVGNGVQAKIHVIAFQHFFNFERVQIWGRTVNKVTAIKNDLEKLVKGEIAVAENLQQCVSNADVIVTTTYATVPLVKFEWLKTGCHINAVGAGNNIMELDIETYKNSSVYVDHLSGVDHELGHLIRQGVTFRSEIGNLIEGTEDIPHPEQNTIFESLGMAVEDCAVAKMIYDKYMENPDVHEI